MDQAGCGGWIEKAGNERGKERWGWGREKQEYDEEQLNL